MNSTGDSKRLTSGRVLAVCIGPGGIPKHPVPSAEVVDLGLVGDAHRFPFHGGAHRAVCLFATEDYRRLETDGVRATPPGAFGENLLTEGLDYALLAAGDRLRVGNAVELEIHDVREPCKTLKPLDARFPNLMLGRSGFLCRVLRGGTVRTGDAITAVGRGGTARGRLG
ncbi:MAG: MOSC domain-containing protein [Planctomycetes bacterium]|nr:MOSC domain-containing protein [Planctomycetota bacterium]